MKKIILLVSIAFLPGLLQAQVTLDSVLATIRSRHPMLHAYASRSEALRTYAGSARAWMAPEAGGGFWMLPYRSVDDPRDKGQIMLSVQQKFTNPKKQKTAELYLQSKANVEEASAGTWYNELRAQARTAYYQWVILEKQRRVLKENENTIQLLMNVIRARIPYNQSKPGDLFQAEARLAEVQNMLLMNGGQIRQKNIALNQLMNVPATQAFRIDTTARPELPSASADTSQLIRNRSDIRKIDNMIASIRLGQQAEKAQARPDFSVSFSHMFARSSEMQNQFMLTGMMSIPIAPWSKSGYTANIRAMEYELMAARHERNALLNESSSMIASMQTELETLSAQLRNYEEKILPALSRDHSVTLLSYQENRSELTDVLEKWESWSDARMRHIETLQRYYELIVSYEKLLEE